MSEIIAITGADGFIGKALVKCLSQYGYRVKALVHHWPVETIKGVEYILYDLCLPINTDIFKEVSVLIHLAFQFKPISVTGTDVNILAAQQLKALQLPMYIFVSSFAAIPPVTQSYYGKTKAAIESIFAEDIIIRPALVLGNGGLYKRIKIQLGKSPFVPLLNGGNQIMQTIFIDDLVNSMVQLMRYNALGVHHLAHPHKTTYKTLINAMATQTGKPVYFVPVPVFILKWFFKLLSFFNNASFSIDNLEGLLASKYVDTAAEQKSNDWQWLNMEAAIKGIN